eukprot:Nitzschia sp. Nitz4//scaffold236_size30323//16604//17985//NITZ4_007987-RA/size30323-augustus-gene-0.1-mRNA-1//-1//CDS//3329543490//1263//frame0
MSLWVKTTHPLICFRIPESLRSHGLRPQSSSRPWDGTISRFSEFADHVLIGNAIAPITAHGAIQAAMGEKESEEYAAALPSKLTVMTPRQLLELGSVWYLPTQTSTPTEPKAKKGRSHEEYVPGEAPQSQAIVMVGDGYCVINKAPQIPVHATVDNVIENVIFQLKTNNDDCHAVPVQRIDVGTSGLLVVATNRAFAAYFAQLLRRKTKQRTIGNRDITRIYKFSQFLNFTLLMKHKNGLLEVYGPRPSSPMIRRGYVKWKTGRNHQIRGQMAQLGFHLVGDELYGGAAPLSNTTQSVALQCYKIGFWEADYVELWDRRKRRHTTQGVRSERWAEIVLDQAWWAPMLGEKQ